ncbi:hypothetical protein OVA13_11785 [Pseudoxanthomonas sp. SL93]|uniref:hypothetical protein n=1 Tax=Pseudoxanthomonas sp. SL93 TaxID=2995142 RepID=UPI00226D9969|nr:hypothetical protein [Pseudoxanthomonas sp. SL93]WAC62082.1 hypothetical protein OVA13_11785 [Pseudoxanthomonas sp. SL93]
MRTMIACTLALLVAPSVATAQNFKREYDRFKDTTHYKTTIRLSELDRMSPLIDLELTTNVQGDAPASSKSEFNVDMLVTYNMSTNRACMGTGVDLLSDGKPMTLESAMPTFFSGNHAITSFTRKLTFAEVSKFAGSNAIEVRVCGTEYTLTADQRGKLVSFLDASQRTP